MQGQRRFGRGCRRVFGENRGVFCGCRRRRGRRWNHGVQWWQFLDFNVRRLFVHGGGGGATRVVIQGTVVKVTARGVVAGDAVVLGGGKFHRGIPTRTAGRGGNVVVGIAVRVRHAVVFRVVAFPKYSQISKKVVAMLLKGWQGNAEKRLAACDAKSEGIIVAA